MQTERQMMRPMSKMAANPHASVILYVVDDAYSYPWQKTLVSNRHSTIDKKCPRVCIHREEWYLWQ